MSQHFSYLDGLLQNHEKGVLGALNDWVKIMTEVIIDAEELMIETGNNLIVKRDQFWLMSKYCCSFTYKPLTYEAICLLDQPCKIEFPNGKLLDYNPFELEHLAHGVKAHFSMNYVKVY